MGAELGSRALRIAVKDEAGKRAIVKALDTVIGELMYTNSRIGFEFILPGKDKSNAVHWTVSRIDRLLPAIACIMQPYMSSDNS